MLFKLEVFLRLFLNVEKAVEAGKSVFIDYKVCGKESDETKKFVDGLRRSFDKVEVLVCLSSIHSELYNKKVTIGIKLWPTDQLLLTWIYA